MSIGHNSKTTKAGPVNADRLKSFIERIERMEEERKAIGGDIRDIYAEAKGVGYDVKTVRWVVQERRMDAAARAERDALRDVYQHALDTAVGLVRGGLSLREAGRITGASKSSIHRALAVPAVSHDADGVITGTGESCGARTGGGVADSAPPVPRADATAPPHDAFGSPECVPVTTAWEKVYGPDDEAPATPSMGAEAEGRASPSLAMIQGSRTMPSLTTAKAGRAPAASSRAPPRGRPSPPFARPTTPASKPNAKPAA